MRAPEILNAPDSTARRQKARELFEQCVEEYADQPIPADAFQTNELVEDLERVREALNLGAIHLMGTSYGSQMALVYLRRHPDSIRSVILDSVVPPNRKMFTMSGDGQWKGLQSLFSLCAADEVCNANYPGLEGVYRELLDSIAGTPLALEGSDDTLTADELKAVMIFIASKNHWVVPSLLYFLRSAAQGGQLAGALAASVAKLLIRFSTYFVRDLAFHAIQCSDNFGAGYDDRESPQEDLPANMAANPFGIFEAEDAVCDVVPHMDPGPSFFEPVENDDTPVLIVGGVLDLQTPSNLVGEVSPGLPMATLATFQAQGHAVIPAPFFIDTCQSTMMRSFLANPDVPPDSNCLVERPWRFIVGEAELVEWLDLALPEFD